MGQGETPGSNAESDASEPAPLRVHTIRHGEHLSAVARQYGFLNFETIWNAKENAHLRAVRADPHKLYPGDQVVIPEVVPKTYQKGVDACHPFQVHVDKLMLRLRVLDRNRKPIANEVGSLLIGAIELPVATDENGLFEVLIPQHTQTASLLLGKKRFEISVGGLHPVGAPSGSFGRMRNLDLWQSGITPSGGEQEAATRLSVERFQAAAKLPIDGRMSPAVLEKLREFHGN